jgi:hypothetical protein
MHVLGKFLLGLTIVLAAADTYLVAVLYRHREKWQSQIETRRQSLADAEAKLRDSRKQVLGLRNELDRIEAVWGDQWAATAGGSVLNAQTGTLAINGGPQPFPNWPIPVPEKPLPLVYVFSVEQDGASHYLGEFAMSEVQAAQSSGELTHQPPLPTSIAALQALQGQPLRVRETMPAAWRGLFDDYFARQAVIAQRLDFQRNQLQIQTAQLAKSQAILAQRLAELNGDPQPPQGASQQVTNGLVVTIRDEETARNAEEQVLDGLRHDLARKVVRLNDIVAENKEAVSKLPGYEESLTKPDPRTASK